MNLSDHIYSGVYGSYALENVVSSLIVFGANLEETRGLEACPRPELRPLGGCGIQRIYSFTGLPVMPILGDLAVAADEVNGKWTAVYS